MSQNVETLRKAHEAFSNRNLDEAMQLVAPTTNFVDHGRGQTASSQEEFRGWLGSFPSSDLRITDANYIDAGDRVIAQFRAVGTQDRPLGPFPASNKEFSLDVCEIWKFDADGKAIEGHNYSDGLGMLSQLGHIQLAPEAA